MSAESHRARLVELLGEKRIVIVVGAGSSRRVGYPLWGELLELMHSELSVLPMPATDLSPVDWADTIQSACRDAGRLDDYHGLLQRTFGHRSSSPYDSFHLTLTRMGFRGFVTTNFDPVLENAVNVDRMKDVGTTCEPLDLCDERPYAVLDFLRQIAGGPANNNVLHLHGYYTRPDRLVLTRSDFDERYGPAELLAGDGEVTNLTLDNIHRKVVWSLLVTHPVLFVGYSLDDEALLHVLQVVQADFRRGRHLEHFAIVPALSEENATTSVGRLARLGVIALTYPATLDDHSGLELLVEGLASDVGVDISKGGIEGYTERMLALGN